MNTKRKICIGLLIHNLDYGYTQDLIVGVDKFCTQNNLQLIIFPAHTTVWSFNKYGYQDSAILTLIRKHSIEGLIVCSGSICSYVSQDEFVNKIILPLGDLPIIHIAIDVTKEHRLSDKNNFCILSDNVDGFSALIEHLVIKHNRKKIAVMTGPLDNFDSNERFFVLQRILTKYNIPIIKRYVGNFSKHSAIELLQDDESLDYKSFDTFVVFNDLMALGVSEFLRSKGIKVPDDVILTGFDDALRSSYDSPTLTTIKQQIILQAEKAAELLFDKINGKQIPQVTVIPSQVIYRQSCGCIKFDDYNINGITQTGEKITWSYILNDLAKHRFFMMEDDLANIRDFMGDFQTELDLQELLSAIKDSLKKFGIKYLALCLYSNPVEYLSGCNFQLPNKANVVLSYAEDDELCNLENAISFNPQKELIPSSIFPETKDFLLVKSLYNCKDQLGYIIATTDKQAGSVYETLFVQLSTLIRSAQLISKQKEETLTFKVKSEHLEKTNKKLNTISKTDPLTGVYNRRGLFLLSQRSINRVIKNNQTGLVIFADMDGLKIINDTYGHDAGDRSICAVAETLQESFRVSDIIARIGGDEFVIVAPNMKDSVFEQMKETVHEKLAKWCEKENLQFTVSVSMGYIPFSKQSYQLESLITKADELLYEEKKRKHLAREKK